MIAIGNNVEVTSLVGVELGVVESINYKTGIALVYFDYAGCPHFDKFSITQLKLIG